MPFKLHTELPDIFWTHNSGGEHFSKHLGDIGGVQSVRIERDKEPFSDSELEECMFNDGLVTVRHRLINGGAGEIAGYALADRFSDPSVLDLKDLYVAPSSRERGLGGFLLARLITLGERSYPTQNMTIHRIPTRLVFGKLAYGLSGDHIKITAPAEADPLFADGINEFKDHIALKKLSVILEVNDETNSECLIFRDGQIIRDLFNTDSNDSVTDELLGMDSPELAAVHVLNDLKLS